MTRVYVVHSLDRAFRVLRMVFDSFTHGVKRVQIMGLARSRRIEYMEAKVRVYMDSSFAVELCGSLLL